MNIFTIHCETRFNETKKFTFDITFRKFGTHHHFVCERCGAIIDLEVPIDPSLDRKVNEATPYTVRRHRIEFYGVCDRCGAAAGNTGPA